MDKDAITVIRREELFDLVWKVPISRLAEQYSLSDVGLAKICKKLKVPRPPRGYWSKIQFGKKVERPPLPKLLKGEPSEHSIVQQDEYSILDVNGLSDDDLSLSKKRFKVPDILRNPHQLVAKTRDVLKKCKPDEFGVLHPWRREYLDIRVSPRNLNRTLRIMDTIVKGFDSQGVKVIVARREREKFSITYAGINGEKIPFSIKEKVKRIDHVPTQKELENQKRWEFSKPKCWDYAPTGNLELKIEVYQHCKTRKRWSDARSNLIEAHLGEFFSSVHKIAEALHKIRKAKEEKEKKEEEESKKSIEQAARIKLEQERLQNLELQSEQWAKSQLLRKYIQAVEETASSNGLSGEALRKFNTWIKWAKDHAELTDPVNEVIKQLCEIE